MGDWWRSMLGGEFESDGRYSADLDFRWRYWVSSMTNLLMIFFGLAWSFSFFSYGKLFLAGCIFAVTGGALVVFLLLRKRPVVRTPASHFIVAMILAGTVVANYHTGGLAGANVTVFFIMPAVALTALGRAGLFWVFGSVAAVLWFEYLHWSGYVFPNVIPEEARALDSLFSWLTSMIIVVAMTYAYEQTRSRWSRRMVRERDRAEEAVEAKSQFLANVSHEFRTPMNAIVGFTNLLLQSETESERRANLETVRQNAFALLHFVDDILEASRLELGKLVIHNAPFEPRLVTAEVIDSFQLRAKSNQVKLAVEIADKLPKHLLGDKLRFRQILVNLLDNAIKFTESGSVTLRLEKPRQSGLRVVIHDTGSGIPAADIDRIFDSFAQVEDSDSRKHQGLGLGLAVCRHLVEAMDGAIEVESTEGEGSVFRVFLPFAETDGTKPAAKNIRILAVEDDEAGRVLVETILQSAGYLVDLASSGQEALTALESALYHLVIMDVRMPGMDGLEVTRRIRAQENADQHITIMALTAQALAEERERCFVAGMDDFITKPIEAEPLIAAVSRWVGNPKS